MVRAIGFLALTICLPFTFAYRPPAAYQQSTVYVCPMHPEVQKSKPGKCPKCGMKLVARTPAATGKDGAIPSRAAPGSQAPAPASQSADAYTCPMHPEIRLNSPGNCPT